MYHSPIQAAGHEGALQDESGELFIKPSSQQEVDFYTAIACNIEFLPITFRYMGTLVEHEREIDLPGSQINQVMEEGVLKPDLTAQIMGNNNGNKQPFIVLENGLYGFKNPSVIDIKLGSVLWDQDASLEKKQRLEKVSSTTTSGSLGYRIAGMNIYNYATQTRHEYDKLFGRNFTADDIVPRGLKSIFPQIHHYQQDLSQCDNQDNMLCLDATMRVLVLDSIKRGLRDIYNVIKHNELRMVSTSVFIIYEGDLKQFHKSYKANLEWDDSKSNDEYEASCDSNDDEEEEDLPPPYCTVKLIDFAHSKITSGLGPDYNVLNGLHNLIQGFKQLQQEADDDYNSLMK